MKDLIVRLTVIYNVAKDIHYQAHGIAFYGVHLLMDRVADGLNDYIDDIKENLYLGRGIMPPSSREILKQAEVMIPDLPNDDYAKVGQLASIINGTIENISELVANTTELMNGDIALLDDIAKDLRKKLGLLKCTVNEII